ncbi:hypothetical protein M408DRAFT_24089 [Serendipita vermifera MAFF 305830]|uniref:Tyrosinase copper-binding domain-containing protein n=1 Tax=Serendipita vermifera MAFF 305830 TaxID=933852 RepID=A0A0C2XG69_SERVB|nr:hypothetical protein M408DRAFT_24089 [Serendipita vermifera MAFF 305830]
MKHLHLTNVVLLFVLPSFSVTVTQASSLSSRAQKIPWIDYAGIESAARDALHHVVDRRALADPAAGSIAARGSSSSTPKCKKIEKRKEWRQLSRAEKKDYMRATKCLQTKGNYGISKPSDTLYDAFTQVHTTDQLDFHINSAFMLWHRWFGWIHHQALKYECGYSGPAPFWNVSMDYKNPFGSPIYSTDPEIGFGTHGTIVRNEIGLGGYQVDNGAFANLKVNIPIPHYLTRNFSYWKDADPTGVWGTALGESFSPKQVNWVLTSPTYWDLEINMDGLNVTGNFGIHDSPHYMLMGDLNGPGWVANTPWALNGTTAPNDPVFWLHHQNVDRILWTWQQQPGKQWEYNGYKTSDHIRLPTLDLPPPVPAHPSDILPFHGLGPDIPAALALKTENWPLCYTF